MTKSDLIKEIKATYEKHGWALKTALLSPETTAEMANSRENTLDGTTIKCSSFDALWFSRPSQSGYEAWELRMVADTPYALFERVAASESNETRAELFQTMEERLRQYVAGS